MIYSLNFKLKNIKNIYFTDHFIFIFADNILHIYKIDYNIFHIKEYKKITSHYIIFLMSQYEIDYWPILNQYCEYLFKRELSAKKFTDYLINLNIEENFHKYVKEEIIEYNKNILILRNKNFKQYFKFKDDIKLIRKFKQYYIVLLRSKVKILCV